MMSKIAIFRQLFLTLKLDRPEISFDLFRGVYAPRPRLGSLQHNRALGSPNELLDVGVGDNYGLVVNLGGMLIERVGGLGSEVAVLEVEVKRADAVRAADAGELRTALDPLGCVVSHNLIVSPTTRGN